MKKKRIISFIFVLLILFSPKAGLRADNLNSDKLEEDLLIFTLSSCPHCLQAKNFLNKLAEENSDFNYIEYNLSSNSSLINEFYTEYGVSNAQRGFVPAIFYKSKSFIGFNQAIQKEILSLFNEDLANLELQKEEQPSQEEDSLASNNIQEINDRIFLKKLNLQNLSFSALSVVLGLIDGFNICSLGALVLILSLVMVLPSRKKIVLFGSIFLFITGITYASLIFLWHRLFTSLAGYIKSIEIFFGLLAILGGLYLLREYYLALKRGPICSTNNILSRLRPKLERIFAKKHNYLFLILSVALFSLLVTVIEFPCSAVIPVIFASAMVEAKLAWPLVATYIFIYMIFYLLDEILIFAIAVWTKKIRILSSKFINLFNLLAALIFLALGLYYLL